MHRWSADLGDARLDAGTATALAEGVAQEAGERSVAELAQERDALIVAMLKATASLRKQS